MAGDWIKFRTELVRSPKVFRVAAALKASKATVLGAIVMLWSIADEQTTNGLIRGVDFASLDAELGVPGFCAALSHKDVDWARETDKGVLLPRWGEHNGKTAKTRALNARRNARLRDRLDRDAPVTQAASRNAHLEQEQQRAREEQEKTKAARQHHSESGASGAAAPEGSAKGICSLLLLAGIPGMKSTTAAVVAKMARSEAQVAWAIERTKAAMAEKTARNPVGYLRSLVANEDAPPGWVRDWQARQLAKAGAREAISQLAANGGSHG